MIAPGIEDVSSTKRKALTPKQRIKMFEAHKGTCVLCQTKINDPKWTDEHIIPLAQGGSNDLSNRGPAHNVCAGVKTNGKRGDNAMTAKAKRNKVAAVIGKAAPVKPIQSAGFTPTVKPKRTSRHNELARRRMFVNE